MSKRINTSQLTAKSKDYKIAFRGGVRDGTLLATASNYRSEVSKKYISLPQASLEQKFNGEEDFAVSVKYDGEGVFVLFDSTDAEEELFIFNSNSGRVRMGLKCLDSLKTQLVAKGVKKALFAGELYLRDPDNKRTSVSDTVSASFSSDPEKHDQLCLAMYDIVMLNGVDYQKHSFSKVWEEINSLFSDTSLHCHCVEGEITKNVKKFFDKTIAAGKEGIVVRSLVNSDIFKIKPALTVDAVVIGYVEDQMEDVYGVASLLTALTDSKGNFHEFVRVGSGFTDSQRERLLESLQPFKVASPVLKTDSQGRQITFVKPTLIVEVEGESLDHENYAGRTNLTQTFSLNNGEYEFTGLSPVPHLSHATFAKFREDKTLEDGGARLSQVTRESSTQSTAEVTTPAIVKRVVASKSVKNSAPTFFKKAILIKTNNPSQVPYVVYFVDGSMGRKEPYSIKFTPFFNEQRAHKLFDSLVQDMNKKGWTVTDSSSLHSEPI